MKYRVSDTDIISIDKVEFIEVDGRSINFHTSTNTHQSIYNNDMESNCVFNNIVNHFATIDLRFSDAKKPETEAERKEKAFEMFWNLYDKKVDKPKARLTFMNLTITEMGDAIKGVKAYVDSTPDRTYRKFPRTWLNARGWENEIKIDKKKENRYVKPKYISDER
jgi:hypothetical protein